jgi:transposase
MLADEVDVVIGVDTHRDAHALGVVAAHSGAVIHEARIEASAGGYRRALRAVARHAPGRRAWAVEGSGAYGAGLVRFLQSRRERVIEIDRPERRAERSPAKSDSLDALRAARTALGRVKLAAPRTGAEREALRVLMVARSGAVAVRCQAIRQLKALIITAPEPLRARLRHLNGMTLLARCATLHRPRTGSDPIHTATVAALRALARRALAADGEASQHERDIAGWVRAICPQLLAEPGVGPICAAQLLISWSHPGRCPAESSFARLAGVAPIPASSGQVVRHRLDRGGDRQLNRALHTIVLSRRQRHAPTRAYIERRIGEGKSTREAVRCLKRYVARHLFRLLESSAITA